MKMKQKLIVMRHKSFEDAETMANILRQEGTDFEVFPAGNEIVIAYIKLCEDENADQRTPFTIVDTENPEKRHNGYIHFGKHGIGINLEGCGTRTEVDSEAQPIWVEFENSLPRVVIHGDINEEDATNVISLEGTFIEKRFEE